jgi:hypothetical protein
MTRDDLNRIVEEYLDRLEVACRTMPGGKRRELVAEISQHIRDARERDQPETEETLREILLRTGRPEDIATASGASLPGASRSRALLLLLGLGVLVTAFAVVLGHVASPPGGPSTTPPPRSIVVSLPRSKVVPSFVGLPMDKAVNEVQNEGYWHASCTILGASSTRTSIVKSQDPTDRPLPLLGTVRLGVLVGRRHRGRYTVEPQLILSPLSCATIDLHQAGLRVSYNTANVLRPGEEVYSQTPVGGEQLVVGTVVHLVVSRP